MSSSLWSSGQLNNINQSNNLLKMESSTSGSPSSVSVVNTNHSTSNMSGLDNTLDKIMNIIKTPELTAEQQRTIMLDSIHNW